MVANSTIHSPWPLTLRRLQYQVLPIVTVLVCASLAGWMWARQTQAPIATGEVQAVRVEIESKFDGILEELPRPVQLFDAVASGQVVARLDTSLAEAELRRLEVELAALTGGSSASSSSASSSPPSTAPASSASATTPEWYRARIDELRARINAKDIKSPISGTVVRIDRRPGEAARLGRPILTIASDHADGIVGYLHQEQTLRPSEGMLVEIRSRTRSEHSFHSHVSNAGAQVEAMPYRHWRNPQVVEWGLPVQIAIPKDSHFKPGEIVDLILKPREK